MSKFKPGDQARVAKIPVAGFDDWSGRIVIIVGQVSPALIPPALHVPAGIELYQIEFIDGPQPPMPEWCSGFCIPHPLLIPLDPPKSDFIPAATRALFTPKPQPVKA